MAITPLKNTAPDVSTLSREQQANSPVEVETGGHQEEPSFEHPPREGNSAEQGERGSGPAQEDADETIEQLQSLRSGPLATTAATPSDQAAPLNLDEIKKLLFPDMDLEKATPQELINHLLLNHNMDTHEANRVVEFLAANDREIKNN